MYKKIQKLLRDNVDIEQTVFHKDETRAQPFLKDLIFSISE